MKDYRNTDYALNKHSKGIVYKFADGIIETTLTDYLRENPEKTEEDFDRLKKLSDEIYYQQDRHQNRTSRLDVSIYCLEQADYISMLHLVADAERKNERSREQEQALIAAKRLLDSRKLTDTQKHRFYLYFFEGLSTRQIALQDEVHQRAVWDSLRWAIKKLKKYFKSQLSENPEYSYVNQSYPITDNSSQP